MNFAELHQRLADHLRERVRSGEITERSLARTICVSQPHIHNVLKGKRTFSTATADVILRQLDLDLVDLIRPDELLEWRRRR
jgi:plasmid maintenance system antidote protein VapI